MEVDPLDRFELETPLHKAAKYANEDDGAGAQILEMLLDAGADVGVRNKAGSKAGEIIQGEGRAKEVVRKAEVGALVGDEVVGGEDEGPTGSASDSD